MRVAVVGSRNLSIQNLKEYLPKNTSVIISGGACGVDTCAKEYALSNQIDYIEILPDYHKYGKYAPLKRNLEIIKEANIVIAFWDGQSRGTKFVIENCKKLNIPVSIITPV